MISIQLLVLASLSISCSLSFSQPHPCLNMTVEDDTVLDASGDCCTICESAGDDPLAIPGEVLRQLTNISEDSQGLLPLWRNAFYLATENQILTFEVSKLELHLRLSVYIIAIFT